MANKVGRQNKQWTTREIIKLNELRYESPVKVAYILGKTWGSVCQERFRRGLTRQKLGWSFQEINQILQLRGIGFTFEQISIMVGRSENSVAKLYYKETGYVVGSRKKT